MASWFVERAHTVKKACSDLYQEVRCRCFNVRDIFTIVVCTHEVKKTLYEPSKLSILGFKMKPKQLVEAKEGLSSHFSTRCVSRKLPNPELF